MLRHYFKKIDEINYLYIQQGNRFYRVKYKYADRVKIIYTAHLINNSYYYDNWIKYKAVGGYKGHFSKFRFEVISKKDFIKGLL